MWQGDFHAELAELPVNRMVQFVEASVCLNLRAGGAVLSVTLQENFSADSLRRSLDSGFASALLYEAGVAVDARQNLLQLVQWLPTTKSWLEAATALEAMLNQRDLYRSMTGSADAVPMQRLRGSRDEYRLRASLAR